MKCTQTSSIFGYLKVDILSMSLGIVGTFLSPHVGSSHIRVAHKHIHMNIILFVIQIVNFNSL